jgi:hypothetical protein
MGALREKMIVEMKLRNFAARTQKSYLAVMVGLAKHYRQFSRSTNAGADPHLSLAFAGAGTIEQFAERGHLGATVFLSAGFGMEPSAAVLATEKKRTWRLPEVFKAPGRWNDCWSPPSNFAIAVC